MSKSSTLVTGLTLVATLGGLLFGYDTAVISGAVTSIDANFIDPLTMSETAKNSLSGFTISSALVGCIFGGLIAGWLCNAIGRKGGLLVAAVLFLVSAIGSAVPEIGFGPIGAMGPEALTPFIIYRILCGVGIGIASMLSPLYIAEIAPAHARGRLISYNQMAIVLGIVLVFFVNYSIASHGSEAWLKSTGWRLMLGSEALPALAFLLLLLTVPDTPRYLVMKGRTDQALDILRRLGGDEPAETTLAEIQGSLVVRHEKMFAFGGLVIAVGLLLSIFQQLVGINAVLYYAPLMFKNLGASTDSAFLQTVVVGAANTVFTLVAIFTVDRLGRKPLMLIGAAAMAVAMIVLGTCFYFHVLGLAPLIAIIAYIAAFALSWGPVTWVLLAEIFPNSIKGKALGLAVAAQWIANLAVSWSFKIVDGSSALNAMFNHATAYWLYGIMSILAFLFVAKFVPETKGRRLEQIQEMWGRPTKAG